MAQRRKIIRVIQQEYRILNWRSEAHLPTPPLYTTDEALCSKRGTLYSPNMSLLELTSIPTLPLIPTLLLIFTLLLIYTLLLVPTPPLIPPFLQ